MKPIKDLSVLVLAQRKHDRQLWAELLKNCGINHPLSMSEIEQASATVGSGQVDVVFVDEAYGPKGIASVLIPARNVEFAGGRGICLVLCSKRATTQDVINARNLGFASLIILPASTDTVRKHLELATRYIPKSDEELGWSAPKIMAKREQEAPAPPEPKDSPEATMPRKGNATSRGRQSGTSTAAAEISSPPSSEPDSSELAKDLKAWGDDLDNERQPRPNGAPRSNSQSEPSLSETAQSAANVGQKPQTQTRSQSDADHEDGLVAVKITGRSGKSAEEEMVYL
ncbi:hypothetical protein [Cohaesibacter sp. ES.047]|uniref:hypothetical protein n=1 Tax=Cohaesibacter sp. ES.047 TaxID=1798205 RepID=UPI0012FD97DC|nr:hypothetical protein [Cohaesibacter sp. ES.047]